jgi:hypothetical protein
MLTGALKPTEVRFVCFVITLCLLIGTTVAQGAGLKKKKTGITKTAASSETTRRTKDVPAQTAVPALVREWGPYLDVAYELTYWDKSEIREWRENREKEIGETLAAYITSWTAKLADSADTADTLDTAPEDDRQLLHRERDYLRLAIAQTVDYLQNESLESLNRAAQTLERLKDKASMPEIAYWTGFVAALQAMENNEAGQFVNRVYDIWNNGVKYMEQGAISCKAPNSANDKSAPFQYRNIVNLVINRAIIDRKLADVNALGPLFLMLRERNMEEKEEEGNYFTKLVQRIAEGLVAPDSDRYRLNFTVAVIEAKRLQQLAAAKLDTQGMSEEARTLFERSRFFDDCALKWAASRRSSGAVTAVVDYLDITSFAIERLADNKGASAYDFFVMLPTHDGLSTQLKAMAIYNDIATYTNGGWVKAGYASRELYLKATHRLWRAIMELALWTGDFYIMKLNDKAEQQNIFSLVPPMQTVLGSYIDFLASQKKRGFPDVIPDFAYFGAAEAAEKLAYGYLKSYTYSTDIAAYNLWFLHRLQATEMFPLDPQGIAQTASILKRDGRYDLFLDYFLPLANRFRQSGAVRKWLANQQTDSAQAIHEYISSINEVFSAAPGGSNNGETMSKVQPSFVASFRQLREELQRKPDHPVHKLLKAFYLEEMQRNTNYTMLLKDSNRPNPGM